MTASEREQLFDTLKNRFNVNKHRHLDINWVDVEYKLNTQNDKIISLYYMEATGGEPDVIGYEDTEDYYIFCDCSTESPQGRRSLCYDQEALNSRKQNKPADSAMNMANLMGIEVINEQQYFYLQSIGKFDTKTSSWLNTPAEVRKLGGALYGDLRFDRVFIYHNGAESYYAARGFRGVLKI